jgi:hypothetical protein
VENRRIAGTSQPGQIVHETLSRETLHKSRAGGVAQGEGPEFKPQYCNNKKKIIKERKKKPLWAQPKALVPGQPCHLLGQTPKPFCAIVSPPMTGNNNSTYLRKSRIVVLKM